MNQKTIISKLNFLKNFTLWFYINYLINIKYLNKFTLSASIEIVFPKIKYSNLHISFYVFKGLYISLLLIQQIWELKFFNLYIFATYRVTFYISELNYQSIRVFGTSTSHKECPGWTYLIRAENFRMKYP